MLIRKTLHIKTLSPALIKKRRSSSGGVPNSKRKQNDNLRCPTRLHSKCYITITIGTCASHSSPSSYAF